jgi:Uma2 family endonuclease
LEDGDIPMLTETLTPTKVPIPPMNRPSNFEEDTVITPTTVNRKLITGEELAALGDIGRTELIKGELVYFMPTGHPHSFYEGNITIALGVFVQKHQLGRVLPGEVGIYTHRQPDTVRGADVAFISHERLAQVRSKSFLDVCPELLVEIMSPDDTWFKLQDKLEEYFAVGAKLIWLVDPRGQRLHVYHSMTEIKILTMQDELTGSEVLPGFRVAVAELFN